MEYFIEMAYKEAIKSNVNNKYGAVIIYRNKIIGYGHNYLLPNVSKYKSCVL
jgi:pyrimidine deaminase RibD-like protein